MLKQHWIVLLTAMSIVLQYVMLFIYGGDSETVDPDFGIAKIFALVNCIIYLVIASLEIKNLKDWQVALLILGVAYLALCTLVRGRGYVHMLGYVDLLIAVIVFSQIRLSRKSVKLICAVSVIAFLFLYFTSVQQDIYFVSKLASVSFNRNHFCKLIVVNIFMALIWCGKNDRKLHLLYLIVYTVGLLAIIQTGSRTSLICGILLILGHIASIKLRKITKRKLFRFFVLCMTISVVALFIVVYAPDIFNSDTTLWGRAILSGREKLYLDAIDTLFSKGKYWFGNGFGEFTASIGQTGNIRTDTHNQWLQFALNYGLIFFALMLYIYYKAFKSVINSSYSIHSIFFVVMQIVLFAYFVTETLYNLTVYACLLNVVYLTNSKPMQANSKNRNQIKLERRVIQ